MLPLLIVQATYAVIAWWLAVQNVSRASAVASASSKQLARALRELRKTSDDVRAVELADALGEHRLAPLVRVGFDPANDGERTDTAQDILDVLRPRIQLLRGLATIGTTGGLLAAILALRFGLADGARGTMEAAAARALDSAVLGFVTAIPCWTAVAICRRQIGRSFDAIDSLLRAMAAPDANGVDASGSTK